MKEVSGLLVHSDTISFQVVDLLRFKKIQEYWFSSDSRNSDSRCFGFVGSLGNKTCSLRYKKFQEC